MKALAEVIQDKQVNNLTVGIVSGLAIFQFAGSVFNMLVATVMKDSVPSPSWDWKSFAGQAVLFVLMMATAAVVRSRSK